jgi:hypothetical protein
MPGIQTQLPVREGRSGQQTKAESIPVTIASDQDGSGYQGNSGHVISDTGAYLLAVRNDGGSTMLSTADGNYSPVAVDAFGRLLISPDSPVVISQAQPTFAAGQDTINTSAVQLNGGLSRVARSGVTLKSVSGNSGRVYIGTSSSITTSSGYELAAGESVTLPVNNINLIWMIGSAASQQVSWLVV